MKKYLATLALVTVVTACAIGRVQAPNGITIEGYALGHSKLVVCMTSTSTTTSSTTTTSTTVPEKAAKLNPIVNALVDTVLVPTITPVTTTTSTTESTDAGCAKIEGGSLSSTFTEMVGMIGTALVAIFTHGAIF